VLVLALLFLASGPDLVRRGIGALPPARRPRAEALAHGLAVALGGYLAGLAAIILARVVATGAFLALARIPFVVPLAMLAGVSVAIPYAGSILRFLAIGAAAWATRGSGGALAALAFLAAYDVVENYLVSPIVYRRTVGVSAVGQILAVLFLGYHFGVVGAVLAIPLAATAQLVARALMSPPGAVSAGPAAGTTTSPEEEGSPPRVVSPPQHEAPAAHPPERRPPSRGPLGG
jgi:predicted PurR-regulated permease PerM